MVLNLPFHRNWFVLHMGHIAVGPVCHVLKLAKELVLAYLWLKERVALVFLPLSLFLPIDCYHYFTTCLWMFLGAKLACVKALASHQGDPGLVLCWCATRVSRPSSFPPSRKNQTLSVVAALHGHKGLMLLAANRCPCMPASRTTM